MQGNIFKITIIYFNNNLYLFNFYIKQKICVIKNTFIYFLKNVFLQFNDYY